MKEALEKIECSVLSFWSRVNARKKRGSRRRNDGRRGLCWSDRGWNPQMLKLLKEEHAQTQTKRRTG
jgi:hypothetical protein